MPEGLTSVLPQLPPIPPQTPFVADEYPWERHYPPSSWPVPAIKAESGRSKSTSPGMRTRPLPVPPFPPNAASSSLAEVISPPPRSHSRSKSHSRSGSRVLVLPSAASAEPIVISPPLRTHSRSTSTALPKIPPRPSTADAATKSHTRSKSRPLPLPLPPKGAPIPTDHILVRSESLPIPLPKTLAASAPAAPQPIRHNMPPQPRRSEEAVPMSAPVIKPGPSHSHNNGQSERGRSTQAATGAMSATRSRPPQEGLDPTSSPRVKRSGDDYARKWVLEKKGKRLTQDTMVVAQQLRLLR
ncbi:hypothetical protein GY45DRAFT_1345469 [Cubamyces sp. BRFM 1775]|nr:hypothetical protein GY45DRAFT_1345469 [Cubamyces sp. BRFM 1775]